MVLYSDETIALKPLLGNKKNVGSSHHYDVGLEFNFELRRGRGFHGVTIAERRSTFEFGVSGL